MGKFKSLLNHSVTFFLSYVEISRYVEISSFEKNNNTRDKGGVERYEV